MGPNHRVYSSLTIVTQTAEIAASSRLSTDSTDGADEPARRARTLTVVRRCLPFFCQRLSYPLDAIRDATVVASWMGKCGVVLNLQMNGRSSNMALLRFNSGMSGHRGPKDAACEEIRVLLRRRSA